MAATAREAGTSEMTMRRAIWAWAALAIGLRAETRILTYDASGGLVREAPAVLRKGGQALVARESLKGASTAQLFDDAGAMHPVLWVTGEDAEAGIVEVFVGLQAPAGPDAASALGTRVKTATHAATAKAYREAGVFGPVARLDCGKVAGHESSPLYDEHGLLAGWHAVRTVDGQALSFALPLERLEESLQLRHETLADWNRQTNWAREEALQKGLAYEWAEDSEGALYYFRKATEAEPANGRAWFHRGFAEGKTGHTKAKMECYRKTVELEPGFAPPYYYLGFSMLMAGDRDGAVEQYKRLKELSGDWARRLKLFLDAAHVDVLEKGHGHGHEAGRV